jgi:hypothetical protein
MTLALLVALVLAVVTIPGTTLSAPVQVMMIPFGAPGDVPVVGRWTGNATTYIGVYRPSASTFYLRTQNSAGPADRTVTFGLPGDVPVVGRWCPSASPGAAPDSPGVYRPSVRSFIFQCGPETSSVPFGDPGDIPVAGDWWSKGVTAPGVYRPSEAAFLLYRSPGVHIVIPFGATGDLPVIRHLSTGSVIGLYRPTTRTFILSDTNTSPTSPIAIPFGATNDIPLVGDWTGDGVPKVGVYRPSESTFYLKTTFP